MLMLSGGAEMSCQTRPASQMSSIACTVMPFHSRAWPIETRTPWGLFSFASSSVCIAMARWDTNLLLLGPLSPSTQGRFSSTNDENRQDSHRPPVYGSDPRATDRVDRATNRNWMPTGREKWERQ